ncbi:MAG: redoxin domain-containing protein [Pirellulales bacterium]|nr:redoxin domain-containing protein [Pirellulales bacterium]
MYEPRITRGLVSCAALAATLAIGQATYGAKPSPTGSDAAAIGKTIHDFHAEDFRGKEVKLSDLSGSKVVVVAFLGVECPLAKLYAPRLVKLASELSSQGVAFVGIDSNRQDSLAEIADFARDAKIEFPLLKDTGNVIADQIGATRTPQVFLLDQDRVVRYAGRIDDQYGIHNGGSYQRPAATSEELKRAIGELLAGKPVSAPVTEADGCLIGRARPVKDNAEVTYSKQIARIFNANCVECHRDGQIAPFALTSYDESAGWADMIAEVVSEGRMPPWHADPNHGTFSNDARLSNEEKQQIAAWAAAGAPQGDPSELPPAPQFASGWQMPDSPDAVIHIADKPYTVPAEGTVAYQYFMVDPGFTEDKWVRVAECLPDNRSVVHHIIVFVKPPTENPKDARGFQFLVGYAPGTRPYVLPDGMAKLIPAGSKLVFQMHYTSNGTEQVDRSSVGLCFVKDPKSVKQRVVTGNASNGRFVIPAGDGNHEVKSERKFVKDTTVMSLFPHMHLRGKSFRYELAYADGRKEILLDVPRYDFNWQNHFIFEKALVAPAGSVLKCTAHFDNSEENLANPDPTSEVRWGDQTWEEMMIGWYDIAVPAGDDPATYTDHRRGKDDEGE